MRLRARRAVRNVASGEELRCSVNHARPAYSHVARTPHDEAMQLIADLVLGAYIWTFLREARDPSLISPGASVVAGDEHSPAVAEFLEIVEKPAGACRAPTAVAWSDRGLRSARSPGDHLGLATLD